MMWYFRQQSVFWPKIPYFLKPLFLISFLFSGDQHAVLRIWIGRIGKRFRVSKWKEKWAENLICPYKYKGPPTGDNVKICHITSNYDILRCRLVKLRLFTSIYDILRHIPLRVLRKLRQITSNYVKLRQITSKYDILRSHDHIMNISKFNFKLRRITAFHDIFRSRFIKLRSIT